MNDRFSSFLIRISAIGLVLVTLIIGWQVFGRFVLNSSPSWSEQASLILMIWYVFFAAAAGVHEGFHIRIDLLERMSNAKRARQLRMLIHVLVVAFGVVLLVYGAQLAWLVRGHVIPSLGLSRGLAYLPLPVSGLLMAIFATAHFIREWRGAPLVRESGAV